MNADTRRFWATRYKHPQRALFLSTLIALPLGYFVRTFTTLFVPSPMTLCNGLSQLRIAKDCALDPASAPSWGTSVAFTMRSNGRKGHIVVFGNDISYYYANEAVPVEDEVLSLRPKQNIPGKERKQYTYRDRDMRYILYVPGPLDVTDKRQLFDFNDSDDESAAKHHDLSYRPPPDHPKHTDSCLHSKECLEEGKCAVDGSASDPRPCVAGFDEDCFASTACKVEGRCEADFWECK